MNINNYLDTQLLTYLGNKRNLKKWFIDYFENNTKKTYPYSFLDGFSGSGIISRISKTIPNIQTIYVNDWEEYSYITNCCYLSNLSNCENKYKNIIYYINKCNENKFNNTYTNKSYIYGNYSPLDDNNIQKYDRCFFTSENGIIIDNIRNYIKYNIPEEYQKYCLGPLLYESSVKNNTCGYFNSFYKDKNQIGKFGGNNENDLKRIKCQIHLPIPIFSIMNKNINVSCNDMNKYVETMENTDITYYDPPYNKHPYGTFYFLLNEITNWDTTNKIDLLPNHNESIRGQYNDWKRSDYNSFNKAEIAFENLISKTKSNQIIISYYNKGIIPVENMKNILKKYGSLKEQNFIHKPYHKLIGQGSKFRENENKKNVNEFLFILNKKRN